MGKISKPQKSNKQKKLKFVDPFYNGERKERMHAGKNEKPVTTEQGLSRSMKDFIRRVEQTKEMKNKSRKQKKEIMKKRFLAQISTKGAEREFEENPVPKKQKGETESQFIQRVDAAAMAAIKESQIEATFKNRPDPVMEDVAGSQGKEKRKERMKMKKQLKKEKKKQKLEDRKDDFEHLKDEVKFGEVVHGPPSLNVRPRHATADKKPAVQDLLLYKILKSNSADSSHATSKTTDSTNKSSASTGKSSAGEGKSSRELGKTVKRKLLSPSKKRQLDIDRQKAIDMFRQMKRKKREKS